MQIQKAHFHTFITLQMSIGLDTGKQALAREGLQIRGSLHPENSNGIGETSPSGTSVGPVSYPEISVTQVASQDLEQKLLGSDSPSQTVICLEAEVCFFCSGSTPCYSYHTYDTGGSNITTSHIKTYSVPLAENYPAPWEAVQLQPMAHGPTGTGDVKLHQTVLFYIPPAPLRDSARTRSHLWDGI